MKTKMIERNGRLFHITIEHTENRWYDKITVHEITQDGIKFRGKYISHDIDSVITDIFESGR